MIGIAGGGVFGTALAVQGPVVLWARDPGRVRVQGVTVTGDLRALDGAQAVLLCVPMQALPGFLAGAGLDGLPLVACCKGLELSTLQGPSRVIGAACPAGLPAVLTGPSFATDIAAGLPTALTLACADEAEGERLQAPLSSANSGLAAGDRPADHRNRGGRAGRPPFHRAGCAKPDEPTLETGVTPCVSR